MGRALRARLAIFTPLLLAVAAPAARQDLTDASVVEYRGIVARYRDANAESVTRLRALPQAQADALASAAAGGSRGTWTRDDLRAAAMLHTDAAVELLLEGEVDSGVAQLLLGARLIDAVLDSSVEYRTYAARWYRFAAAFVRPYSEPWAREIEQRARPRVPVGPAAAALWRVRQQELTAAAPRRGVLGDAPDVRGSPASGFEEVVRLDPEQYEAWLHLGRARMDQGRLVSAGEALRVASRSPERRIRYLAAMFLGSLWERSGRFDEAERAYRDAALTYPWAQSAPLAIAHVLSRTSRESEARDVLAAHLGRMRGMAVDPLWTYFLAPDELLDATLMELRAEVLR